MTLATVNVPLNFTVRVDRSIQPTFPNNLTTALDPELDCSGPAEFDLSEVVARQPRRDGTREKIRRVYERIKFAGRLVEYLNLADLVVVRDVYHREFCRLSPDERLYGWKSGRRGEFGRPHVPYIYKRPSGIVVLEWAWMDDPF
jgi:hypothetical protein